MSALVETLTSDAFLTAIGGAVSAAAYGAWKAWQAVRRHKHEPEFATATKTPTNGLATKVSHLETVILEHQIEDLRRHVDDLASRYTVEIEQWRHRCAALETRVVVLEERVEELERERDDALASADAIASELVRRKRVDSDRTPVIRFDDDED